MNTRKWFVGAGVVLAVLIILVLAVGLTQAQGPGEEDDIAEASEAAAVSNTIPIQGRLTDSSGNPLDGSYDITATLYDASTGGNVLCTDEDTVTVDNGLFHMYMGSCTPSDIDGKQLWLGIEVESDGEMTPRQPILPVPYAFSLRPGAVISDTRSDAVLNVRNHHGSGKGIYTWSLGGQGVDGVSSFGTGVRGLSDFGCGVEGSGTYGAAAAICAVGNGRIKSSANSYIWVSGNGVRPYHQSDSTVIDMDSIGGAIVTPGVAASARYVILPVTVTGPLYGQDVTISDLDIYWVGDTDNDAITDIRLRRQTGVCNSCYDDILHDPVDHTCYEDTHAEGCTLHYDLTSNNVLTADSGVLYLMMQLTAIGNDTWIRIGGARLTLEHD